MVVILRRSFSSSSLRSSIFSVRLWFSIFSCSKSMRCKPSASCSFSLTDCSSRSSLHSRLSVARPCVGQTMWRRCKSSMVVPCGRHVAMRMQLEDWAVRAVACVYARWHDRRHSQTAPQ